MAALHGRAAFVETLLDLYLTGRKDRDTHLQIPGKDPAGR